MFNDIDYDVFREPHNYITSVITNIYNELVSKDKLNIRKDEVLLTNDPFSMDNNAMENYIVKVIFNDDDIQNIDTKDVTIKHLHFYSYEGSNPKITFNIVYENVNGEIESLLADLRSNVFDCNSNFILNDSDYNKLGYYEYSCGYLSDMVESSIEDDYQTIYYNNSIIAENIINHSIHHPAFIEAHYDVFDYDDDNPTIIPLLELSYYIHNNLLSYDKWEDNIEVKLNKLNL